MEDWNGIAGAVGENEVLAAMQAGPAPDEALRALVREEMARCRPLLRPRAAVRLFKIAARAEDRLTLENGAMFARGFPAGALAGCGELAVTLCTVGGGIDGHIRQASAAGDYPRAMAADSFAVLALQQLGRAVENRLAAQAKKRGLSLIGRLAPGDGGWALREQAAVLACLPEAGGLGVTLAPSGMMEPLKSVTAVYGIGTAVGSTPGGCAGCGRTGCAYRGDSILVEARTAAGIVAISARRGQNLLELLRARGLMGESPCGGRGLCGKCRVVCEGAAPAPTAEDRARLTPAELAAGVRLACRMPVAGPLHIRVPAGAAVSDGPVALNGRAAEFPPDPAVKKAGFSAVPADGTPDLARAARVLGIPELTAAPAVLARLHEAMTSPGGFTLTAAGNRLLAAEAGNTAAHFYGAAADIGTTTVVVALVDLRTGRAVEKLGRLNCQRPYGADVITRIQYARDTPGGAEALRALIVGQLNAMLRQLCARHGLKTAELCGLTVAANTAMLHLLLGVPAGPLAEAPYTPAFTRSLELPAGQTGIEIGGPVRLLPGVSAFVGADITAGLTAGGVLHAEKPVLFLDLGTNGEMALGGRDGFYACAVAAGPAFEGGGIRCGMAGVPGAVSRVDLDADPVYETIGGQPPAGLCGSGVLDTAAQLFRHGVVEASGRLRAPEETDGLRPGLAARLTRLGEERAFAIAPAAAGREAVVFTQKDVRQVQLAKAAFAAGIRLLLRQAGLKESDVGRVLVAGGFGSYMRLESAFAVGLLPASLRTRTVSVGNAAGEGARLCLISRRAAAEAEEIARRTTYIEISDRPDFEDAFLESMAFGGET